MSRKNTYLNSSHSSTNSNDLCDSRIITKNLVYVIGLSHTIASQEKLISYEYFGQYGLITKMVVNKKKAYNTNSPNGPSYSAYVTYAYPHEASIAILCLDNKIINNHLIRASFGTTKYCSFFLQRIECINKDCLFLHRKACDSDIIKREDLNVNKNIFYDQHCIAIRIANIYNPEVKKSILSATKTKKTVFPSPDVIYKNNIVIENDPFNKENQTKIKKCYKEDISSSTKTQKSNIEIRLETKEAIRINTRNKPENQLKESNSKDEITCASTSDEKTGIKEKGGRLFISKERSRFEFVNDKEQYPTIPQFVIELVNKKYQMDMLGNSFKNKDNLLLFDLNINKEAKHNNSWAEFIVTNSSSKENTNYSNALPHNDTNLEDTKFIHEVENINCFIFDQANRR